jgi:uncharacterized protein (TIGR02147 family)
MWSERLTYYTDRIKYVPVKTTNHSEINLSRMLSSELEKRMSKNSNYSLRAFSRDLGLDPSHLSAILKGKKGIAPSRALELAKTLKLNAAETLSFQLAIERDFARSSKNRKTAEEKIVEVLNANQPKVETLSIDQYQQISEWYSTAILEYLRRPRANQSVSVLAKTFSISAHQVTETLNRLERLEFIEKKNNRYQVVVGRISSTQGIPSEAIRTFHSQMLSKAEQAIHFQSLDQRHIRSTTLVIQKERIPEVKAYLAGVWDELAKRFADNESGDSVYNMGFQVFELGKIEIDQQINKATKKKEVKK